MTHKSLGRWELRKMVHLYIRPHTFVDYMKHYR